MSAMDSVLAHELPYWAFEDSPLPHLILWDGSLSSAFELLPLDIECFNEAKVNQLTHGLRAFINSLSDGLTAQFFVKVETDFSATIERHKNLLKTKNDFLLNLDNERINQINLLQEQGAIFRPRLFFSIKTEPPSGPPKFSLSSVQKFSKDFAKGYDDRLQILSQALEGAKSMLSGLGFEVSMQSKEQLIEIIYKHLNPKRSQTLATPEISEREAIEGNSPREQAVFGDLILDQEDFVLDQTRTKVLTLKTLPEVTFAGMMSGFLSFPFKYELFFSFHIPNQAKEIKSLEQKRRMAHSLANSNSNRVSDLESESRLSQTTNLIREIIETGQKIFQAELVIVLRDENTIQGQKNLSFKTREVLSKFRTLSGSEGLQETVGSWKVFKNDLPLAPQNLIRLKRMKTNNLVDFLPLYGASLGDENPVVLLKTRSGSLFSHDPYDSKKAVNFNVLVTGSSGAGKSFANNFLMLQQIARGTKVFIIDIGGSYQKMTKVLNGQYFEINLAGNYAINPFDMKNPSLPPSSEKLKALVSIVEQMVVDSNERLTRFERVQLESALVSVFEKARSSETPRSPILSDLAKYCLNNSDESLRRIGKLLFPWTGSSPFGQLLDRQGTIETDRAIVAFDLKGLQDPDLQSVMILILTNFILEQVELDRTVPKRVLVDEAWSLLKGPAISFMEYAARTFRKTGSGITFITQGVGEIISSGIGSAILNNTATKLIMLQKGDTKVLQEALNLNSQELKLIQSLEQKKGVYSEGFLISGESRQVIRIQPSPLEYWISTSDSRDNQYISKLMDKGLTLEGALMEAAKMAPYGVAASKMELAA